MRAQTLDVHRSAATVVAAAPLINLEPDESDWLESESEENYFSPSSPVEPAREAISEEAVLAHQSVQPQDDDSLSFGFSLAAESFTETSEPAPVADSELLHINAESDAEAWESTEASGDPLATADLLEAPAAETVSGQQHSQEEWPVLMVAARRSSFSMVRAAMVILTLLVSVAAIYFLIYLPLSGGKAENSLAVREVSAAAVPAASESAEASQSRTPAAEPTNISQSKLDAGTSSKPEPSIGDARGQFSLQAAAFPVESGAAEFAEKLKRAGLPSYVVSADVGKRGIWYRVRVGRFESAEAAKRYAAEAQLRSKATGVSLQLIVCPYEQH
ncbi:MAG TPA: SPOR domain-containing protein [Blastocatellia bacterium]|nr:SPOR domain-containing protein [Blastocatellia bacterium]